MINKMKEIKNLLEIIIENNYEKIIQDAINIYFEQYIFQIKKLIDEFPIDHTNEDGSLFYRVEAKYFLTLLTLILKIKIVIIL